VRLLRVPLTGHALHLDGGIHCSTMPLLRDEH
jgi:hypothetical protein